MIEEVSEKQSIPSWKGQLNIAKQLNKNLNLSIPDEVFSNLNINMMEEKSRLEIPDNSSKVLVLDIKLKSPKRTLEIILQSMSCRHDKCIANGLLSGKHKLEVYPYVHWQPGLSWKILDLRQFIGKSTTYVRNKVPPLRLPTSSVGWFLFFSLIDTDGIKAPFLKAPGFHIDGENPGSVYNDKRTVGFQSINGKFSVSCLSVDDESQHWANPVLCEN